MKGQSLTEYLYTYGFAIIIIIIVAICLYALGVFNPEVFIENSDDEQRFSQYTQDFCDEYARYKYDKGYYYAKNQFNNLFNCVEINLGCLQTCVNYTSTNISCMKEYHDKYNKPFGEGYHE